jgi:hypothetical protein
MGAAHVCFVGFFKFNWWCGVDRVALFAKGAFPPSHFGNKLADRLTHKVSSQTNVAHFCYARKSEVCSKQNWFAANSL